jgi:S-adenosylmethionine synthetase
VSSLADRADYLFTSESVSAGHPDKVSDQISDAVLDSMLMHDPDARSAIETFVTTGLVLVGGELKVHTTEAEAAVAQVEDTVRQTIKRIGYDDPATGFDFRSCGILRTFHSQSSDISQGVTAGQGLHKDQGAGDQGLMFGYACDETRTLMPLAVYLAHRMMEKIPQVRQGPMPWIRPDAKSQVTIAYKDDKPIGITAIVLSAQHTEEAVDPKTNNMSAEARQQIIDHVIKPSVVAECPDFWSDDITFHINPTGRFIIGGPHGDAGLTGRKIIVDTYGGRGRHGGGAFSGKDPSKVDRSAAYMARYIAKNIVASGLSPICEIQLAYAIGVADPVSVHVDTFGTSRISTREWASIVRDVFPLTPCGIIDHLNLKRPIFQKTAAYGHFGREDAEFTWEKTDKAEQLKSAASQAATV